MATPANQDQVSPPSSAAYEFKGPPRIAIRARTNDQPQYVDTRSDIWTWYDGGIAMSVNWSSLKLHSEFSGIAKAFMVYALEKYSPSTAYRASRMLQRIAETDLAITFPWSADDIFRAFKKWSSPREYIITFRTLYRWARNREIRGFDADTYLAIKDFNVNKTDPYSRIFLSQTGLELYEELSLLKRIQREPLTDDWESIQRNLVLHIGFELAPRNIQFYSLNISDFEAIESSGQSKYYTIWLPMAKKIGQRRPERRPRKITSSLGAKIESHISELKRRFGNTCEPLFVNTAGERLSVIDIRNILKIELSQADIERPYQVSILLRHHLGQGLADQGSPAELIAELLGHNSTVAARAYVTATPNIARIKEKALGKSPAYQRIMRSLLTGEIVQRHDTKVEREVRGVVDMQYIGDIGACALPAHTNCPYNPVYACYTCKKFHPFADGRHELVKEALQHEAQRFIDIAVQAGELQHNRPLAQHQATILAVTATIERCQRHKGESKDDSV